jgi:hypothetical protein
MTKFPSLNPMASYWCGVPSFSPAFLFKLASYGTRWLAISCCLHRASE